MTARMRRLASDWEQVKKDFTGHKNIVVTPMGGEPPEKYHVTYFVNGIYLLPDGRIETLNRHEVEITLHADYPRYKPICKILTPIWHPNFRDGQICIGDIWGAGESLSDIIINIGDMIQYKSWNSYSPLSADAAQWAMENKHLFPVGNVELHVADYASAKDTVEIDLFDEGGNLIPDVREEAAPPAAGLSDAPPPPSAAEPAIAPPATPAGMQDASAVPPPAPLPPAPPDDPGTAGQDDGNDFEITAEELAGIQFVPTAQRMQTVAHGGTVKGGRINFKTILVKGLLWALIGAFVGFGIGELLNGVTDNAAVADLMGYSYLSDYYEDYERALELYDTNEDLGLSYYTDAMEALDNAYTYEFDSDADAMGDAAANVVRISTAIWSAIIALFMGLSLGLGEGVFYGSAGKALQYAAIGAGVSLVMGFISGYLAQWMYASLLGDEPSDIAAALIRGLGWAVMGLGVGVAVGLIKPAGKRILYCSLGGLAGGFLGGFLFNYICMIIPDDIVARGTAIVIMGLLIGLGVGLLEQFAKQAWLKVIRGEFEGKEYLVFAGTTSIGNNGKNTIVLFKDKLVGPHHCDIILEGNKYVLVDCGTPMGTVVNGMRITRHVLRQGDAIAIGNSVLVFNTK